MDRFVIVCKGDTIPFNLEQGAAQAEITFARILEGSNTF